MHRLFYILYCLIGFAMLIAIFVFAIFILPTLDQYDWVPDLIRRSITAGNDFLARGAEGSRFSTIMQGNWFKIIGIVIVIFSSTCMLVFTRRTWKAKASKEKENKCIPLTTNDLIRLDHLATKYNLCEKMDDSAIRTSVFGEDIVISQGALDKCTNEELMGLFAHELGHIDTGDSLFKELAVNARLFYRTVYGMITLVADAFWGIISRVIFFFGGILGIFFWGRSEKGNEMLSYAIILSIIFAFAIIDWVGRKLFGYNIMKSLEKVEEKCKTISLTITKFLLYDLTIGWLLLKGDDFSEYKADRYALKIGCGNELLQGLLHTQNDESTVLSWRIALQLRRRIRKLKRKTK